MIAEKENETNFYQSLFEANVQIPLKELNGQNLSTLYPALQSTFLVLDESVNNITEMTAKVIHIDINGSIIKQIAIQKISYAHLHMMSQKIAIIQTFSRYQQDRYQLIQWDIQKNLLIKLNWKSQWYNKIFVFSEEKILSIEERSNENKSFLTSVSPMITKITCFKLPFNTNQDKPLHKLILDKDNPLNYYDECLKINNSSKIGWLKKIDFNYQMDFLTLSLYDSLQHHRGVRQYKLSDSFLQKKHLFSAGIDQAWQYQTGLLYVKCRTWLSYFKCKEYKQSLEEDQIQRLLSQERYLQFIWNYQQGIVHPFKMQSTDIEGRIQFSNGLRPINKIRQVCKRTPQVSLLKTSTYSWEKIPIYYVNADNLEMIGLQKGENFIQRQKNCYVEYDKSFYLQYRYLKGQQKMNVSFKNMSFFIYPIGFYLAFIIEILIANCHEDLIFFVIQLIDEDPCFSRFSELPWKKVQG